MGHSLKALLAAIALAASPVSATTVATGTPISGATAPSLAQAGTTAKSSPSSSQAQADATARKVAKAAAKQAKKCAKWARKAASAHSDLKRAKYTARYNSSCVTAAMATTKVPSAPPGSTVTNALVVSNAISEVTGPWGVLAPTAADTGSSGSNGFTGNGLATLPVESLAVRFAPALVTTQVPEPGTLALLGLGLVGLGLSRRRRA